MNRGVHLRHTRLGRRQADIRLVQEASGLIKELADALDRQLTREDRPPERLRMLRETTNQITRIANDAIRAYGRVRAALNLENELSDGDRAGAEEMGRRLSEARAEVLAMLDTMNQRYAWGYGRDDEAVADDDSSPATDTGQQQSLSG